MSTPIDYFDSASLRQDLKGKTVRGGMATAIAQVICVCITLVSIPILSRLLDPQDFGLLALVTVFTSFARLMSNAGLSVATVQSKELTHQQASNLFWVSTALGVSAMTAVFALSPVIAWIYGDWRLMAITMALSATFLFNGVTVQPQALLQRGMRFRQLAAIQVVATIIQQTITVAWAWSHRGSPNAYWALVIGPLVTSPIQMTIMLAVCGWRPGMPRRGSGVREMLNFGAFLSGSSMVNMVAYQADAAILGAVAPFAELGEFDRAKKLLIHPIRTVCTPLAGVIVPALSRSTDKTDAYRSLHSGAMSVAMLVTTPAAAIVLAAPDWCVRCALGDGWDGVAEMLRLLAPAMMLVAVCNGSSWLFVSQGRVKELLTWQSGDSVARIALVAIGAVAAGGAGVAIATSVRYCLTTLVFYAVAGRKGPYRLLDLMRLMSIGVLALGVSTGVVVLLRIAVLQNADPLAGLLTVGATAFLASAGVYILSPSLRRRLVDAAQAALPKKPTGSLENVTDRSLHP